MNRLLMMVVCALISMPAFAEYNPEVKTKGSVSAGDVVVFYDNSGRWICTTNLAWLLATNQFGGDVSGVYSNLSVMKVRGIAWTNTAPTNGQVYVYDAAAGVMKPADQASIDAHAGLTGTNVHGLGTAALAATGDFATAAQGANGATAYGWGDHALAGYRNAGGITNWTLALLDGPLNGGGNIFSNFIADAISLTVKGTSTLHNVTIKADNVDAVGAILNVSSNAGKQTFYITATDNAWIKSASDSMMGFLDSGNQILMGYNVGFPNEFTFNGKPVVTRYAGGAPLAYISADTAGPSYFSHQLEARATATGGHQVVSYSVATSLLGSLNPQGFLGPADASAITNYLRNAANQTNNIGSFCFGPLNTNGTDANFVFTGKLPKTITITELEPMGSGGTWIGDLSTFTTNFMDRTIIVTGLTYTAGTFHSLISTNLSVAADLGLLFSITNGAAITNGALRGKYTW
jgi:hypothetical protein